MIVTYHVPFVHGKERPRLGRRGTFTPKDTERNESRILNAYEGASIRKYGKVVSAPAHVPVTVALTCTVPAPKTRPRWWPKRLWDAWHGMPFVKTPDIDNVLKEHMDALNHHAWHDDAQVAQVHAWKLPQRRGGEERANVMVFWEEEEE
ncbi:MAG: RusA family crossover junction endodeoxyribonuclease [Atopobiaceae bacterium]|nr:RusA family crossover junction endodeoxyribonuclease [Atopobiaceae bacterium]